MFSLLQRMLVKLKTLSAGLLLPESLKKAWERLVLVIKVSFVGFIALVTIVEVTGVYLSIRKSVIVMPFTVISPDQRTENLGQSFSETLTIELDNITQMFERNLEDVQKVFDVDVSGERLPPVISSRSALEKISVLSISPSLSVALGKDSVSLSSIFRYVISLFTTEYGKTQIRGSIERYDNDMRIVVRESPQRAVFPIMIKRPVKQLDELYGIAQEVAFQLLMRSQADMSIRSHVVFYELMYGYRYFTQYTATGDARDLDTAQKHFAGAVGRGDNDAYGYYNLGVIANEKAIRSNKISEREKSRRDAIRYFERAIAADPLFAPAHAALLRLFAVEYHRHGNAACLEKVKNYLARSQHIDNLIKQEKNTYTKAALYHAIGQCSYITKNYDRAVANYQEAVNLRPDFGQAHKELGDAYLKKGEFGSAEQQYYKAEKNGAAGVGSALCTLYNNTSQFDKMIESCAQAKKESHPSEMENRESSLLLGYGYVYRGINSKSRQDLESGLREIRITTESLESAGERNHAERGYLYQAYGYAALNDQRKALDLLRRVKLLSDPRHADYWFYLATCAEVYSALGKADESCRHIQKAFKENWDFSLHNWFEKPELSPLLDRMRPNMKVDEDNKTIICNHNLH